MEADVQTDRGKAFDAYKPTLNDAEIQLAIETDRMALSLAGEPVLHPSGIIKFLAIKIALADGSSPTVLLDRLAAAAIKKLIAETDSLNWNGNPLRAGPTPH